ncbi:TPA: hypothetical protein ACKRNA_001192 [Proteus mirabilis]
MNKIPITYDNGFPDGSFLKNAKDEQAAIKSYSGMCIWCHEEPVAPNSAYCSKDCGDDHEQYKRKNG